MNQTRLRPTEQPAEPNAEQHTGASLAPAARGGNEAVRDFFRRGDRGLYEGGPADHVLDSLSSWDLPVRAPIVRTPQQQARRVMTMWIEGALMIGCVAFLVTAALKAKSVSDYQSAASNAESVQRPITATISASRATPGKPAMAVAPRVAEAKPAETAPVPSSSNASPAVNLASVHSGATNAAVLTPKRANVTAAKPSPEPQRTKSARQPYPVFASRQTEAAVPAAPTAPKRAVAAFPDD